MKPKYTSLAAIISFESLPTDANLMVSIQETFYSLIEEFDFLDPESGSLSVPIYTDDGNITYIYTMRPLGDGELSYNGLSID